jgi:hypothetical protein
MNKESIIFLLKGIFFHQRKLSMDLYIEDLEDQVSDLKIELKDDRDDFVYAITIEDNDIAFVLIHKKDGLFINHKGIIKLRSLWGKNYKKNINKNFTFYIEELINGSFPVHSVKLIKA